MGRSPFFTLDPHKLQIMQDGFRRRSKLEEVSSNTLMFFFLHSHNVMQRQNCPYYFLKILKCTNILCRLHFSLNGSGAAPSLGKGKHLCWWWSVVSRQLGGGWMVSLGSFLFGEEGKKIFWFSDM